MTTVVKADRIVAAEVLVTSPGRNYVTLKITTAEGLIGWGDATLNGRELAVAAYLRDHVCPLLIGRDPARIEDTWQYLYRGVYWRRGPGDDGLDRRGRPRALGHQGQGGGPAGLPAARRGRPGPDPQLHPRHRVGRPRAARLDRRRSRARLPGHPRPVRRARAGHRVRGEPGGCGLRARRAGHRADRGGLGHRRLPAARARRAGRGPRTRRTRGGAAARRAPPAEPEPGRPAGQGAGTAGPVLARGRHPRGEPGGAAARPQAHHRAAGDRRGLQHRSGSSSS